MGFWYSINLIPGLSFINSLKYVLLLTGGYNVIQIREEIEMSVEAAYKGVWINEEDEYKFQKYAQNFEGL